MNRKVISALFLGLIFSIGTGSGLSAKNIDADGGSYTAKDREFYMTEAELAFIRPGLDMEILNFEIPDDLMPVVEFTLQNEGGMPLDKDGVYTLGPIDVRFMLTYIPAGEEQKVNYHERLRDRGGEYTTLAQGHYTYKFATVLPADYEVDATHTLAGVATRDLRDFDLERFYDNEVLNFIPSGMGEPMPRDIVRTATCNRCHDPLGEHGGRYQEVEVCQQCHTPDLADEEASHSMDVMIHRVHLEMGSEFTIELNDCESCHTGGTPTAEFPLVANPSPIPTCDTTSGMTELAWMASGATEVRLGSADGKLFAGGSGNGSAATGEWVTDGMNFVLVDKASGDVLQEVPVYTTILGCGNNQPGTFRGEAGVLHTNWMTRPSREVCASCHTNVDFVSGENHPPQADDSRCGMCHKPNTGTEYDISVAGAHTVDYKSNQLPGVFVDVKDVEFNTPGGNVRVTFSLRDKTGPLDPAKLGRLRFTITGPNEDFEYYNQEDGIGNLQASGSNWTFRFGNPLPMDAVGSYSITVEGRMSVTLNEGQDNEFTMNNQIQNFTYPIAVTDDVAMPRRMIVDDAKCESCHSNLSLHGTNRHDANASCQSCHRPDATDAAVRLEGEDEAIHFKYMVHKLHRGADLDRGYVVYGYRSSVHDYSHVEYPGDLRNCETCHVDDTHLLPLPDYALDTVAPADYWSPLSPTASTCMSCHDSLDAAAHTQANTSELGESCNLCHGQGAAFSVEKVHAR